MLLDYGVIASNLTVGGSLSGAKPLQANGSLCGKGVALHGSGFVLTPERAEALGRSSTPDIKRHIRLFRNGRDLTIDLVLRW